MSEGPFREPMRRVRVLLAAALAALPAGAALAADCAMNAREIYEARAGQVVDVFSVVINPFRVIDRLAPKSGSGFLVEGGHVATNYHVVADASEVFIYIGDESVPAYVEAVDPTLDLAVLSSWFPVPGDAIPMAGPGSYAIGDPAFVLGNPLGIGKSVSAGVVSGLSRVLPLTTSNWLSPYIQTDAAVSAGNSGGPLLDACGAVIGMVSAGIFDAPAENIGLAIPVEVLAPALKEMIETGRVARPWHGLYGQMTIPPILALMGVPEQQFEAMTGFMVETVEPGSAADRIGLRGGSWPIRWGLTEMLLGGDIITEVNGTRILSLETALEVVRGLKVGQEIRLVYYRDGMRQQARVTLEERPLLEEELDLYRQ